jgi:hypothetical protein
MVCFSGYAILLRLQIKDSSRSAAICCASSAGIPIIIRSGGSQGFPVGSVGPTYAESFGAFSAMPAGKVSIVAQVGPPGINVLRKGSELLKCANSHRFLICSLPANRIIDPTASGAISSVQGPMTMYLSGG